MGKESQKPLEPPSYGAYTEGEREAFLSQLGNFTPYQRSVFHALCKENRGQIKYKPFAERMSLQIKNVHSEIEILIKKLNIHRMAVLLYSYDSSGKDKERKKDSIILTDQGDQAFYRFSMQQLFDDLAGSASPRLPTGGVLEESGLLLPDYMISEISAEQLRKPYIQEIFITPSILSFPVRHDEHIFFLSSHLNQTIQLCIQVIKDITQSSSVLADFARFKNTSITAIKQNLSTRTPSIWMDLTRSIIDFDKQRTPNQFAISDSFAQAAEMVFAYLKNEIEDAKQKNEHEKEIENDLQQTAEKLKKKYFEPIGQEKLNTELEPLQKKYGEDFADVKQQFFDRFTKMKDSTKLPPLVFIGKKYIHRNHLHKYIALRFRQLSEQLEEEYITLMRTILKTNNRDEDVTFFSNKNFNLDIETRIRNIDPFVAEILERPRVLAEAIIHVAKEEKQVKDIEQVRHILEQYFEPGTMRYKFFTDIFNLNIFTIFRKAFTLLPVLRQFWMKLTGKFRGAKEKYEQFRPKIPVKMVQQKTGSSTKNPEKRRSPKDSSGPPAAERNRSRMEKPETYIPSRRRKGVQNIQKKDKSYTKKQTDEAWDDFRESLKK